MIREFHVLDTEQIMELWLFGNMDAHSFVPEEYWRSHFNEVQEALLQANIFVCDIDGKVYGFIGLIDGYIAGIFVDKSHRSIGIGTQLLNYAKEKHNILSLSVYQQNSRAIAFYHREGFAILSEGVDEDTGEKEYTMFWKKL